LSPDDIGFSKLFWNEVTKCNILTKEELEQFSKPRGTKVIFAGLMANDEVMDEIEALVAQLKERKVVLIQYTVAAVINECEKERKLKIVSLL
jgi:hypothetical protein